MSKMVGMSRNINLDYLNKVVELINNYENENEIKAELQEYISFYIKDKTNLNKTVNILMTIWKHETDENAKIKSVARNLVLKNNKASKLVAHWCMMIISYNVFCDIASTIGKLDDKQLALTSKLIREKVVDSWGERTTLIHAIPKNIKTMKDIGVLNPIKVGLYETVNYDVKDSDAVVLIIATLILFKDKLYVSIDELINHETMFPFTYDIDIEKMQESGLFSFDRFGGEMVISLKA